MLAPATLNHAPLSPLPIPALRAAGAFPSHYRWFVGLAAADVVLTALILAMGGTEANVVAQAILASVGILGMVLLKGASVGVVLGVCEFVSRRSRPTGRRLAEAAVALSTVPVTIGLFCAAELAAAHML
jgi:hypothetical protein